MEKDLKTDLGRNGYRGTRKGATVPVRPATLYLAGNRCLSCRVRMSCTLFNVPSLNPIPSDIYTARHMPVNGGWRLRQLTDDRLGPYFRGHARSSTFCRKDDGGDVERRAARMAARKESRRLIRTILEDSKLDVTRQWLGSTSIRTLATSKLRSDRGAKWRSIVPGRFDPEFLLPVPTSSARLALVSATNLSGGVQ